MDRNQRAFRHSSRRRPFNDSTKAMSVALPGRLKSSVTPISHVSGRAAGSEWLIEDLHQAVVILEERHRWAAEPNAL